MNLLVWSVMVAIKTLLTHFRLPELPNFLSPLSLSIPFSLSLSLSPLIFT